MSDSDISSGFQLRDDENGFMFLGCESSDDDEKRLKRREKNRVAAQKSRKRQTKRADELHEAYECLEEKNSRLKKEVQLLSEEQRCLTEALKAHEPLCPFMHCTAAAARGMGPRGAEGTPVSLPR